MRASLAFACVVAFSGCHSSPGASDAGVVSSRPRLDSGPIPRDAPPPDVGTDAPWPDVGPTGPIVVGRESWTTAYDYGYDVVELTVALDARPARGSFLAAFGAAGHASTVTMNAMNDGLFAVALEPIFVGLDVGCDEAIRFTPVLTFADDDRDGVFEHLVQVSALGMITLVHPDGTTEQSLPTAVRRGTARDALAPTLRWLDDAPLSSIEPLVLVADEPISPSFRPQLVGPITIDLVPEGGGFSVARWTLEAPFDVPDGHYELDLSGAVDLAGLSATPTTITLDASAPSFHAVDDFEPVALRSDGPLRVVGLGDGAALDGATSLLVTARTALEIEATGPGFATLSHRVLLPSTSAPLFFVRLYDAASTDGRTLERFRFGALATQTSPLPEYEGASSASSLDMMIPSAGRYALVIDQLAPGAPRCASPQWDPGIAMILDSLRVQD